MSLKVWPEKRVTLMQTVFKIGLDDTSLPSDHVILPHFYDFDELEILDERHLLQL